MSLIAVKIQALLAPAADVEALHLLARAGRSPAPAACAHEQIDDVHAAAIDDRRHRLAVDIVEPPTQQRKALRGKIDNRRRDSRAGR